MRNKLLWALIACAFLVVSCKKEDEKIMIDVAGTVTDKNTGNSLSGASVKIQSQGISDGTYSSNWETIAQESTGSGGGYSFSFERENVNQYRLIAEKSGYFMAEKIIPSDEMDIETVNTYSLELASQSWFRINVKNTNPYDSTDYFFFQKQNALLECGSSCCDASVVTLEGTDVDTSFTCQTQGGQYMVIEASWTKNGVTQNLTDSVYLTVNDTAVYDLNY